VSLRARIAGAAALAVALVVVIAAVAIYVGARSELRGEVDDSLRDRAAGIARLADGPLRGIAPDERGAPGSIAPGPGALGGEGFGFAPGEERPPPDGPITGRFRVPPPDRFGAAEGFAQLVLPSGHVVQRPGTEATLPVDASARELARGGSGEELRDTTVDGTHLRVLTRALPEVGAIQIARPLDEVDRQLDSLLLVLLIVGVAAVVLGAALAALVARTALAPIGAFTRRTEELAGAPDPSRRMESTGRDDELGRLARSFNATLDSLERAVDSQRQLVADASHELRTPIASLRANIQTLEHAERLPEHERAGLRADIVTQLDELTALVADIVELARGAKPAELVDDVRLDEIVEKVVERARARSNGVALDVSAAPSLVRGDPERIQRAVSNLVDNALKWSPDGGRVDIEVAGAGLSVRDHGPGFDEADLPHVFERFYRAGSARALPGSGRGRAIERQAAEAHGGSAVAENAPGGGALVRVSFGDKG
jgi:two-component system sensor histidine kinase MprB